MRVYERERKTFLARQRRKVNLEAKKRALRKDISLLEPILGGAIV